MARTSKVPEASLLRLSRYHCFLGELLGVGQSERLRSREIAEQLGLSEETVRRDLSFIDVDGRPGAGYDPDELFSALEEFLDLSAHHPFIAIGNRDTLEGLTVTFPAADFGLEPVGYFSERPEDAGLEVAGLEVRDFHDIPKVAEGLGATIALVATAPGAVDEALELLHGGGVDGVLMLTPTLRPKHPDGMNVTYFRMPCALKALVTASASSAPAKASCCGGVDA
jgi:NADH/NAD ratio-sensing transcriptional regulator Rex